MNQQYKLTSKSRKGYVIVWSHREIGAPASDTVFCVTINNADAGLAMDSTKYKTIADAHQRAKELLREQPIKELPAGFQFCSNNPRTIEGERNDCVVRALSLSFNKPYEEVHEICKRIGRKAGKGMNYTQIDKAIAALTGDQFKKLDRLSKRQTFTTFARDNSSGKYLILKRGHAVALIDGVYHDNGTRGEPRAIVNAVYKVN